MKGIIIGAGRGITDGSIVDYHKTLHKDIVGKRVIDWILNSFNQSGIEDVVFVGGFQVENIIDLYPSFRYYVNELWLETNVLSSLMCAEQEFTDDLVISYSDIVFRTEVCQVLMDSKEDITLVVDKSWKNRYKGKSGYELKKAEKVIVENGYIKKIGKDIPLNEDIYGEFIGLCKLSATGAKLLRQIYNNAKEKYSNATFHESVDIKNAFFTDILQELVDCGVKIKVIERSGEWATLDSQKDFSQFIFGTKGETLERLKPLLKKANICDQVRFSVKDWNENHKYYINLIQQLFTNQLLIVRSSTLLEDSEDHSFAGAFESLFNINAGNEGEIVDGVTTVIQSYKEIGATVENELNQVLIQPQLDNVWISGVIFTRDIETGAPYYLVNYDDTSSRTDTVTAGTDNLKTLVVFKNKIGSVLHEQLKNLLYVAQEIETIIGNDAIDIEFAITNSGEIYIFQARPIAALKDKKSLSCEELEPDIAQSSDFIKDSQKNKSFDVFGDLTMYANMPDWNPAEIIGVRPRPLSYTLYGELITNNIWREARAKVGYHEPRSESLMVSILGQPYIDVRISFNSLLPRSLPKELGDKLTNHFVKRLKENPELHDKVEFEIIPTCLSFDLTSFKDKFKEDGFSIEEIEIYKESLYKLTNDIISGKVSTVETELAHINQLNERRKYVLSDSKDIKSIPYKVKVLIDECKEFGTKPFSILARYAFIAVTFLRSFRELGVFTEEDYESYLESIETVASQSVSDFNKVLSGKVDQQEFLKLYGHLRPGTYDITSARYDEAPDIYFKSTQTLDIQKQNVAFKLTKEQYNMIEKLIKQYKYEFSVSKLFEFIRSSIVAREFAKFEFTKNLSDVLLLIDQFGQAYNFTNEEMSYLPIQTFFNLSNGPISSNVKQELNRQITIGKEDYKKTEMMKLPQIISGPEDIECFTIMANRPNYVTKQSIVGETIILGPDKKNIQLNLEDKIVIIECADPGYDWIFAHKIGALITKYGGANSHMAIRCAEFNIPAAIGCGDMLYNQLIHANIVELNCGAEYVKIQ